MAHLFAALNAELEILCRYLDENPVLIESKDKVSEETSNFHFHLIICL
jgi:hypothetical protein